MKNIFTILFACFCFAIQAQEHPTCDNMRYIENVFDDIDTTFAVPYGQGETIGGVTQELFFDIFQPIGDTAEKRPAIILAFGGAYIGGEREEVHLLANAYARKGFVAVCIDYRIYDLPLFPLPTEEELMVVVTRSVHDMKGSIRHLRNDASGDNLYKIDPDWIFIGGVSAGAITALHTGALDDSDSFTPMLQQILDNQGGIDGAVNTLMLSSEVQGIVSFSGGLNDASWISSDDPPVFSVHETGDMTVPYAEGFANVFGFDLIYMEGSSVVHHTCDSLGIKNRFETLDADAHVGYLFDSLDREFYVNRSAAWLHDLMCEDQVLNNEEFISLNEISVYPNPTTGLISIVNDSNEEIQLEVFDLVGRSYGMRDTSRQVDLSDLQKGIYLLRIYSSKNGSSITKKIILE